MGKKSCGVFGWKARQSHQKDENTCCSCDRHQILGGIERHFRIDVRIDRHHATRAHQQRIAVWRRFCHRLAANVAARATLVLHHHGLAKRFLQRLRQRTGDLVRSAAGREVNDDLDGFGRPCIRRMPTRAAQGTALPEQAIHACRACRSTVMREEEMLFTCVFKELVARGLFVIGGAGTACGCCSVETMAVILGRSHRL